MSSEIQKFYFFFLRESEIDHIASVLKKCPQGVDEDFQTEIAILDDSELSVLKEGFENADCLGLSIRNSKGEYAGLVEYDINNEDSIHILGVYVALDMYEEVLRQLVMFLRAKYAMDIWISLDETMEVSLLKRITSKMKFLECEGDELIYDATNYQ